MNVEEYNNVLQEKSDALKIPLDYFFDIEFSPYVDEYLKFFEFYRDALDTHSYYGITPSFLFFANDNRVNARATFSGSYYIISINSGTLVWLIQNLQQNEDFKKDVKLFEILAKGLDTEINNLMYQSACHYTFYHEMAHLVQKSKYIDSSLGENPKELKEFDFQRHVLEYDADVFSSLCIGAHIMQYVEKIFGANYGLIVLESVLALVSCSIIIYLLSFGANDEDMYFKDKTHPHPIVRLTYIVFTISSYCNQNLQAQKKTFKINEGEVFKKSLELSELIEAKIFDSSKIATYKKVASKERTKIIEYIKEIRTLSDHNQELAVNKWNALH